MHTVAYMVLHALDTLPDFSIGALGDNHYLPNTLFQGGVAIVYIPHIDLSRSGGLLPQENFVTLDVRRSLLRPFFGLNLMFCKQNCYMYSLCGSNCRLCVT